MFLYADSPVHLGAGVSLGGVDLPIQRERHTGYPMAQGSGLKGALRHHLWARARGERDPVEAQRARKKLALVFGPDGDEETHPQDHAGAVAFGDGKLLLFPVRSLVGTFAYCTSGLALGRLRRDLEFVGIEESFDVPLPPGEGRALSPKGSKVLDANRAFLEDFDVQVEASDLVDKVATWVAGNTLPGGNGGKAFHYFQERIKTHLLVLDDDLFGHLVGLATVVEPHVKIDDTTGTAAGTAFFYAEHMPPDSLLWSLVGIGGPRAKPDRTAKPEDRLDPAALGLANAADVEDYMRKSLDNSPVQVGAEATTGRGLVHLRFTREGKR
jgi:CRISPR-associated protein Cmr4